MGTSLQTGAAELRAALDEAKAALTAKDMEMETLQQDLDRSRAEAAAENPRVEREAEARGHEAGRREQGRILQGVLAEREARVKLLEEALDEAKGGLEEAEAQGTEAGRLMQGIQANTDARVAVLERALQEAKSQAAEALASSGARHQEALAERDARIAALEKELEEAKGQAEEALVNSAAHYQGTLAERNARVAALETELQDVKARLFEAEVNNAAAAAPAPAPGGSDSSTTGGTRPVAAGASPQPDFETIRLEYEAKLAMAGQAFAAYSQEVTVLAAQIQQETMAKDARHQAEVAALTLEIERLRRAVAAATASAASADGKGKEELERLRAEGHKWSIEVGQLRRLGERVAERALELRRQMLEEGLGVDTVAAAPRGRGSKRVRFGSSEAQGGGGGGGGDGGGGGRPAPKQAP